MIERMNSLDRSTSLNRRALNVSSPKFSRKSSVSQFRFLVVIGSITSFLVAIAGGYVYVLPNLGQAFHGYGFSRFNNTMLGCDVYDGKWVPDDSYPLYNASTCPFAEKGFNCLGNGRKNKDYIRWRWKPKNCEIPRFDVWVILKRLQGKRIVFVGDSMSRTQWESLICLLMTGVEDKSSVYEVNGSKITKQVRYLCVRFSSFNFTVEFFRSVFLVEHGWVPKNVPKRIRSTLKLDKLDVISKEWVNSDVLIFNTGQWWVPGKLFKTDKTRRYCNITQHPMSKTQGRDRNLFSDAILEVVKNMTIPVTLLRITSMSAFRSDAHVGTWSDSTTSVPDCSHWCLPGLPDMWNEIVIAYLLASDGLTPQRTGGRD
ncbi:protein trichome berefringence-like 7 isoform X2 [Malania oleifera]|uniref:protein trichome berefringence-like 7 isoform X2 n=1 Tax=Malania oleifera TaxID=397392 RepID=UPI0025ADFD9B|nr:protein trichome berefringence-like 7 isoform X2 [Malania oleifera]